MAIFDVFKKKKKKEVELPIYTPPEYRDLPSDLERFRVERGPLPEVRSPELVPPEPAERPAGAIDKLDMILQKLETIDARLKLIEERLGR